jgi:hypothetical protein
MNRTRNQRVSECQRELRMPPVFTLVSYSVYSWTMKMEAICFSETYFNLERTIRRYIPENSNPHNHRCENLKSCRGNSCLFQDIFTSSLLGSTEKSHEIFGRNDVSQIRLCFRTCLGVIKRWKSLTASST